MKELIDVKILNPDPIFPPPGNREISTRYIEFTPDIFRDAFDNASVNAIGALVALAQSSNYPVLPRARPIYRPWGSMGELFQISPLQDDLEITVEFGGFVDE